jgi:hypothetical protein
VAKRIKVKLQDSTPARVIFLDPNATEGATLGMDLFTPDGVVGTPATVRAWLGVEAAPDPRAPPSGGGVRQHRLLQGLTLGDDHPQYTQWAQNETIVKSWNWISPDGIVDPQHSNVTSYEQVFFQNPDVTYRGGVQITTLTDPLVDPEANGVGSQIAFWEVENLYGFRIRNTGEIDNEGNLDFYRHANSLLGSLLLRFVRDSDQIQFHAGSAAAPIISTFGDLNTGIYFPAADQIGFAVNGALRLTVASAVITGEVPFRGQTASATVPTFSFVGDTNTGMYKPSASQDNLGFSTGGVARLEIWDGDSTGSSNGIRTFLSIRGIAGSVTVPSFTFTGDDNTGMYSPGADVLGFVAGGTMRVSVSTAGLNLLVQALAADGSAAAPAYAFTNEPDCGMFLTAVNSPAFASAGVERLHFSADGAWGLAGANYGTTGQVLQSRGSALPPIWATQSGGGGGASEFATYLTDEDETYYLPNSRMLLAGTGISFDDSVPGERTIINTLGGVNSLSTEILADSPIGYWKLDEASGNFADSSGNGRTMTAVGSPSYQYAAITPRETTKFVYFDAAADGGTRTDTCGLSVPANADWTVEAIVAVKSVTTNSVYVLTIGATGETEATNVQVQTQINASTALMASFWESGAGVNNSQVAVLAQAQLLVPAHFAWVKDGTANTVSFYINGLLMDVISYATEPTGGSSSTSGLGVNAGGATANMAAMAHVALYNTALSQARIRAHAQAAGFLTAQ